MSGFVLDSSVALSWCFADEVTSEADELLGRLSEEVAVVPRVLWQLEVWNGLLVSERRGRISSEEVVANKRLLDSLALQSVPPPLSQVFSLGRQTQRTSYDAAYLALASELGIPLATFDGGLRQAAREIGVEVIGV